MDIQQLKDEIIKLEYANDLLVAELDEVDYLLRLTGFPQGIASAKSVASRMLSEGKDALDGS